MFKAIRALVVAALAASSLVSVAAAPANATVDPKTFTCSPNFYQASVGSGSADMYVYDPSSSSYTVMTNNGKQYDQTTGALTSATLTGLNPIGYNAADNYIYGVGGSTSLYKIYNDGSHSASLTISGSMQTTAGDFIANDLFLTGTSSGSFSLVNVNASSTVAGIAARTAVAFTDSGSTWGAFDMAFDPGSNKIYGLNGNTLYTGQILYTGGNPSSVSVGVRTVANTVDSSSYGAAYFDSSGNAYFFNNGTKNLWEISAAQLATTSPTATLITNGAVTGSQNDGASCNTASSPLAPIATTLTATSVATTTADLNGSVTTQSRAGSNITSGNLQFCYSTSSTVTGGLLSNAQTCTNATPATQAANLGNQPVTLSLSGLTGGTTYYFQVVTTDANGLQGYGQVLSFTTSGGGSPSYTVTFNNNGGSGSMSNQTGSSAANLTTNSFSRSGYTFSGWNTVAGGSGTAYTDGGSYPFNASVTLYAQWTANSPASYTVTFNNNGGSGSMSNQTGSSAANLTTNSFSRSGYTFSGWNTVAGGSGTAYTDGGSYPFNASVTLYAQWTANAPAPTTYTVNFNSQGGSNFPGSSYTTGGCVDLPGAPTRAGYSFIGWFVAPDAHSNLPSPYCPGSGDGNITLYAHWAASVFPVHYNSQGGSPVADGSYNAGEAINLAAAPTRPGYNFGGWSLGTSGASVSSPHLPAVTGSITFYAIWIAANYTVTFDPNGGAPGATGSYSTGGSLPLAAAPTKAGQVFQGWFLATSGGSALTSPYTPGATGPVTLYAQWAPASYKVAFNPQGGSTVADSKYSTGGCVDLPAAPSRDGYVFNGWFASETGGIALANPFCPAGSGDLSIYAQWTKKADPKPVARGPVTAVISGFADGSPALNKSIKKKIDAFLTKYSDYKVIQCVGFTEGPTVLKTDKGLSIARATNACAYALAGLGNGLKAKAPKFGNEQTESAQLRRVEITLSDN